MSKFSQRNYPTSQTKTTLPSVTLPPPDAPLPSYLSVKPGETSKTTANVTVLADRVEFVAPKIKLVEHIFVGNVQTDKLEPKRAYVAHGVLVIEELGLALSGASFRVTF